MPHIISFFLDTELLPHEVPAVEVLMPHIISFFLDLVGKFNLHVEFWC